MELAIKLSEYAKSLLGMESQCVSYHSELMAIWFKIEVIATLDITCVMTVFTIMMAALTRSPFSCSFAVFLRLMKFVGTCFCRSIRNYPLYTCWERGASSYRNSNTTSQPPCWRPQVWWNKCPQSMFKLPMRSCQNNTLLGYNIKYFIRECCTAFTSIF